MENKPQNIVTNTKIIKIIACGALLTGVSVFFAEQNALAQDSPNCQNAAEAASKVCESAAFECYDSCKPIKDQSFYECQSACGRQSSACYQARNNQYTACVEGTSEQPPTTQPEAQPVPSESTLGDTIYVPALIDTAPTRGGPTFPTKWPATSYDDQGRLQARVTKLDGTADMQLSDGTWVVVEEGTIIPYGATIFTGYAAEAELQFSQYGVVTLRSLAELNIEQFEKDASVYRTELKLETGELRFKVIEADMKTDMKVQTPNYTASPAGTDFGAFYNRETGVTLFEIYDGAIEVESLTTGEKKIISSAYSFPIKRIEGTQSGTMIEKVAIPQSQWADFVLKNQEKTSRAWLWIILATATAVVGYLAYRKKDALMKFFKKQPTQ